jgi:hypothetical protein
MANSTRLRRSKEDGGRIQGWTIITPNGSVNSHILAHLLDAPVDFPIEVVECVIGTRHILEHRYHVVRNELNQLL